MQLDVPLFQQNENSMDCGPICLKMVLAFYGQAISDEDIANNFVHVESGVAIPQLGSYMLARGFQAEIVTLNPHVFPHAMHGVTDPVQIRDRIYECQQAAQTDDRQIVARHLLDFMDNGGRYRLKIPDQSDIQAELAQGRPVISLLTTKYLHGEAGFNFHFNVITGLSGNQIHVNDPAWGAVGGRHVLSLDAYLYAMHASAHGDLDNDSLLLLKPPA